jgi:hypothetical protein
MEHVIFTTAAFLAPVAAAVAAPLLVEPPGWKRPAAGAALLAALLLVAAAASGAPAIQAARVWTAGLAMGLLAGGAALCFRRPGLGQLAAALVAALLIGQVFLLRGAIRANPSRAQAILAVALASSPHASIDRALEGDFLHTNFFYRGPDSPADVATFGLFAPWHRGPAIWAGAGLALAAAALALRRRARAAG